MEGTKTRGGTKGAFDQAFAGADSGVGGEGGQGGDRGVPGVVAAGMEGVSDKREGDFGSGSDNLS